MAWSDTGHPDPVPGTMRIEAEDITVRFDRQVALRSVSLQLDPGSRLGVQGLPGSGKTTLLKVLAGLRRPDGGRVLWDGEDIWTLKTEERRERQAAFGMIFQSDALFDASTLLDNVLVPLLRRKVPSEEARRRADAALESVGLADAAGMLPDQLSGGMRKRAGIARAIAASPEVLLADDPLAGLDPSTAQQIGELLLSASRERTLVVAQPDPVPHLPLAQWLTLDRGEVTR